MKLYAHKIKTILLPRGFIYVLAVITATAALVGYRHLVPKEFPRLLSLDHEIRLELTRAERVNLRTAVICDQAILLPRAGDQLCTIAVFPEKVSRPLDSSAVDCNPPTKLIITRLHRSTVLNL
jgi:hypothetical protein